MPGNPVRIQFGAEIGELVDGMKKLNSSVSDALGKVNANLNKLNETSARTSKEVESSFKGIQKSVSESLENVQKKIEGISGHFKALLGLLAGGVAFKEMVGTTLEWAKQIRDLSLTFGMTTGEASRLNVALRLVGIGTEEYSAMGMKLERQLKRNEAALNELGLKTRDAQGHLLPLTDLMVDSVKVMEEYRVGTDRGVVSQFMFGRGAEGVHDIVKLNNAVMQKGADLAEKLGLVMGVQGMQQSFQYKMAINQLKVEFEALEIAIGEALLPYLKAFADWLSGEGVTVIQTFRQAMETLRLSVTENKEVWQGFIELLKQVGNYVYQVVRIIDIEFRGVSAAIESALRGGFSAASDIMEQTRLTIEKTWSATLNHLESASGSFWDRLTAAWNQAAKNLAGPVAGADKPFGDPGTKTAPADLGKIGKSGGGGKSGGQDQMSIWQEELDRMKDSQTDLTAWSTEQEYKFWNEKLAATKFGSDQWWSIWHKMAEEWRQMSAEQTRLVQEEAKKQEAIAKGVAERQKSDSETAMRLKEEQTRMMFSLGLISSSQQYNQLKDLYEQEYQAELQAYQKELAQLRAAGDAKKAEQEKVLTAIEKLENQHKLKMQQDLDAYMSEEKSKWEGYASTVGNALSGLLTQHRTMYQTMLQIGDQAINYIITGTLKRLADAWVSTEATRTAATAAGATTRAAVENTGFMSTFISNVGKQLSSWVGMESGKTAATTAGVAARTGAEATGAATSMMAQAAAALKSILASAAQTFAGIFGFLSPLMGPAAVGPAAAGEGLVLSMQGMVQASAAGGWWEIPGETVTKLHPKEMVLPAGPAAGLRDLIGDAGSFGGGRRGGSMTMNIQATDAASFEKQLIRSNSGLNRMIKRSIRDFNLPLRR